MKKNFLLKLMIAFFMGAFVTAATAQDEISLIPSELTPSDTGYYLDGRMVDTDNDGIEDTKFSGCEDYYGDADHDEVGTQQGFYYENCMIMPTCWCKNAQVIVEASGEDALDASLYVSKGYIEISKTKYSGTDSAHICFIKSPCIRDIKEIYIEVSPDVTYIEGDREIKCYIEFSTDEGETWSEDYYVTAEVESKNGNTYTYTADGDDTDMNAIAEASESSPIYIRLVSNDQRVKVHNWTITATEVEVGIQSITQDTPFEVINNTVYATSGKVYVYDLLGKTVGYGETVTLKQGIYIIRTNKGVSEKIAILK